MKKLFLLMLTVAMVLSFSMSAVFASADEPAGEPVAPQTFVATVPSDYVPDASATAINDLNGLKAVTGGSVYLNADITISASDEFTGIAPTAALLFDGNGKTITFADRAPVALFTNGADVAVKNLTVKGSFTATANANTAVMIAQSNKTVSFDNVVIDFTLNANAPKFHETDFGLFIGRLSGGSATFNNCITAGNVTSYKGVEEYAPNNSVANGTVSAGAYVGQQTDGTLSISNSKNYADFDVTITEGGLGGFIGKSAKNGFTLNNCQNYGDITGRRRAPVAGLCPNVYKVNMTAIDCANYGKITALRGWNLQCSNDGDANMQQSHSAAGCFAYVRGTTAILTNCDNYGDVIVKPGVAAGENDNALFAFLAAGVIARARDIRTLTITDCDNIGDVIYDYDGKYFGEFICDKPYTGTLVTDGNKAPYEESVAAGVLGNVHYGTTDYATVSNCTNSGKIYGPQAVAGIVGKLRSNLTLTNSMLIENCVNKGEIVATLAPVTVNGANNSCAGGIVGTVNNNGSGKVEVKNCLNIGNVTGSSINLGGIVGYFKPVNANTGSAIDGCVNVGTIKQARTPAESDITIVAAGIIGGLESTLTVKNCISAGYVTNGADNGYSTYAIVGVPGSIPFLSNFGNVILNGVVKTADADNVKYGEVKTIAEVKALIEATSFADKDAIALDLASKAEFEEALAAAKALNVDDYSAASYVDLAAAIENAENANVLLLDDAAISDLIDALESAQEDLVNVAELKDILAELKAMDPADYAEESAYMIAEVIYYFEDLIETATDVEEVEFVLEQFEAVEFVYIADLKASLAEAVAIVKDDCKTEESWNELVKAIAFAYNVLDNAQSQATVDATVAYLDVAVLATAKDADTSILDAIESLEGILGEMGDTLSDMDLEAIEDAIADLSAKLDALTTKVEESGCASSMGSEYIVLAIVALLGAAVLVAKKAKSKNN